MKLLVVVVSTACGSTAAPTRAHIGNSAPPEPPSVVLRMERTECLSGCPVYTIEISTDGHVTWHGEAGVAATGERSGAISRDDVGRLVSAFDRAGFFALNGPPPKFRIGTENGRSITMICASTDSSSAKVTIVRGGVTHSYENYPCYDTALEGAEALVDTVVGSKRWIGAP